MLKGQNRTGQTIEEKAIHMMNELLRCLLCLEFIYWICICTGQKNRQWKDSPVFHCVIGDCVQYVFCVFLGVEYVGKGT